MQPWLDWFQAEYEDVRILKQTAASRIGLCRHRKTGMELVRLDLGKKRAAICWSSATPWKSCMTPA